MTGVSLVKVNVIEISFLKFARSSFSRSFRWSVIFVRKFASSSSLPSTFSTSLLFSRLRFKFRFARRCYSRVRQFVSVYLSALVIAVYYRNMKAINRPSPYLTNFEFGKSIRTAGKGILNFIQLSTLVAKYCKMRKI